MRRYPGVSPFEEEQKDLFKGRESETRELLMKISLHRTLAIHAESGSGKSSIINTSILTQTRYGKDTYVPVLINFEQFAHGSESQYPKEVIITYIIDEVKKNAQKLDSPDKLTFLKQNEESLWYWDKLYQANNRELLLIFDQFELLESYSKPQINYFGRELMRTINSDVPQEYYESLKNEAEFEHLIEKKSKLKLVFVVREDKLGVLTLLKYYFPTIAANDYHLKKISVPGAKSAIVEPALADGEFDSYKFTYTKEALEKILHELNPNANKVLEEEEEDLIDPLELQIVCAGIENNIIALTEEPHAAARADNIIEINPDNLPDFKDIVNQFYTDCWLRVEQELKKRNSWDEVKFIAARKEIIKQLIKDGIRVKVSERSFSDFQKQILQELRNRKIGLVRESIDDNSTSYYQIAHDRFKEPALKDLINIEKDEAIINLKNERKRKITNIAKLSSLIALGLIALFFYLHYHQIKEEQQALAAQKQKIAAQKQKAREANYQKDSLKALQNSYLMQAGVVEYQNPTLSYRIAEKAKTILANTEPVNSVLNRLNTTHGYFVSKRLIEGDCEFITASADNCYLFSQDEINHYTINRLNSPINTVKPIKNLNLESILTARNVGGKIFYLLATPKDDYYSIALKTIDQKKAIATFQYHQASLPDRAVFADDCKTFFLDGVIYRANSKDSVIAVKYKDCKDIMSAAFTHDSKLIMVGYWGGQTLVYDVNRKDGQPLMGYFGGTGNSVISAMDISMNDKYLVEGDHGGDLHIWKIQDAYLRLKKSKTSDSSKISSDFAYNYYPYKLLSGHRDEINSIAISNRGTRIVSGSKDKTAIVWDFQGNIKAVLRGHRNGVDHVQFTNDTSNVITKSSSGEVMIWSASKPDVLFKKNQLELFDRYDYLSIGLDPSEFLPKNDKRSFTNSAQILEKELKTLPYVNDYPDDQAYVESLKNYLKELKTRYDSIKLNAKVYYELPQETRRKLDLAYLDMAYNKMPQLTSNASEKDKKKQTQNKITYYKQVIDEYKSGYTGWNKVKQYLYLYLTSFTGDNFSYTMQAQDAIYIEGVYHSYYIKYPEVKKDYGQGVTDIAYIYYNQKKYLAAKNEFEKKLKMLGDNDAKQAIGANLNILICYLQINQEGRAKDMLKSLLSQFATVDKLIYTPQAISSFKKENGNNFTEGDFSSYYILKRVIHLEVPATPAGAAFKSYAADMFNNNSIQKALPVKSQK